MPVKLFFLLTVLHSATAQNIIVSDGPIQVIPPDNYISRLQFTLREDQLPRIVIHLINSTAEKWDIGVSDILQLSGLKNYNLELTVNLLKRFNITQTEAFTVDNLEKVLTSTGIEFSTFYSFLVDRLGVSVERSEQALVDLGIELLEFFRASSRNMYLYDILRKAILDENHVTKALASLARSGSEVFEAAKYIVWEQVLHLNISYFLEIIEWSSHRSTYLTLWKELGITTDNVYGVDKFQKVLESTLKDLNSNYTIVVSVNSNALAVHEIIYRFVYEILLSNAIRVEANGVEVALSRRRLGDHVYELALVSNATKSIETSTEEIASNGNCSLVGFQDGILEVVEVAMGLTNLSSEQIGNPVICDNRLYAFVGEDTQGQVVLDRLYTSPVAIPEPANQGNLIYIGRSLIAIVFICVIYF